MPVWLDGQPVAGERAIAHKQIPAFAGRRCLYEAHDRAGPGLPDMKNTAPAAWQRRYFKASRRLRSIPQKPWLFAAFCLGGCRASGKHRIAGTEEAIRRSSSHNDVSGD